MGKSTLFNRLTKTRAAIVNNESGTTRDRQYGKTEWGGMEMSVVDTGGWVVNSDDIFEDEINKQVALAIEEADVILFMVDIKKRRDRPRRPCGSHSPPQQKACGAGHQ